MSMSAATGVLTRNDLADTYDVILTINWSASEEDGQARAALLDCLDYADQALKAGDVSGAADQLAVLKLATELHRIHRS